MKCLLVAFVFFIAPAAFADVASFSPDKSQAIVLHDAECKAAVLANVKDEFKQFFTKAATYAGLPGGDVKGCWGLIPQAGFVTIWDDGDVIPIDPAAFEKLEGPIQLRPKGSKDT